MNKTFLVRYIAKDRADIRNGEVYEAMEVRGFSDALAVIDRSGEAFLYPKDSFERLDDKAAALYEKEKNDVYGHKKAQRQQ